MELCFNQKLLTEAMGAGDHHRRDDKNRPIEQQPSSDLVDTENDDAQGDAEHLTSVDDAWASSEGYTPLQDLQGGGGLFSDGSSSTFFASYPGAFFADMGTFGDDDADEDSLPPQQEHNNGALGSSLDLQMEITDHRSVADNALMMLDDEYRRTVSRQFLPTDSWRTATSLQENPSSVIDVNFDCQPNIFEAFVPHFEEAVSLAGDALVDHQADVKVVPEIDAEAVRRAVEKIQLRAPKLKQNLLQWERAQKESAGAIAPRLHPIIPSAPLAAFRKRTAKAVQASANLSRSACIAEALRRFNVLQNEGTEKTLCIHVVGCDHVECESQERLRTLFGPVVRWIGAYAEAPAHVQLDLIGLNVPTAATEWRPLDLLPTNFALDFRLQSAALRCHCAVYEDWILTAESSLATPDLVIAFNAGVWGYREWKTTIQYLAQQEQSVPFVVTAYTLQEAEDDYEVFQEVLQESASNRCHWEPEFNPFSSNQDRVTAAALPGRRYRENSAWQGWRL